MGTLSYQGIEVPEDFCPELGDGVSQIKFHAWCRGVDSAQAPQEGVQVSIDIVNPEVEYLYWARYFDDGEPLSLYRVVAGDGLGAPAERMDDVNPWTTVLPGFSSPATYKELVERSPYKGISQVEAQKIENEFLEIQAQFSK